MFVCQICGVCPQPGQSAHKIVVEKRQKVYPPREGCNKGVKEKNWKGRWETRKGSDCDPGGIGWETVREAMACQPCAQAFNQSG